MFVLLSALSASMSVADNTWEDSGGMSGRMSGGCTYRCLVCLFPKVQVWPTTTHMACVRATTHMAGVRDVA